MTVGTIVITHHWIISTIILNFRKMVVEHQSYNVTVSNNFIIFFKSYGIITTVLFAVCKRINYAGPKSPRIAFRIVTFTSYVFAKSISLSTMRSCFVVPGTFASLRDHLLHIMFVLICVDNE